VGVALGWVQLGCVGCGNRLGPMGERDSSIGDFVAQDPDVWFYNSFS
jgi:hypothetical protein